MALDPIYLHPTEGEIDAATLGKLASDQGLTTEQYILEFDITVKESKTKETKKVEVATGEGVPVATEIDVTPDLVSQYKSFSLEHKSAKNQAAAMSAHAKREKAWGEIDSLDLDLNKPETVVDKGEKDVLFALEEKYSWIKARTTGFLNGNSVTISLDNEELVLDLSPFTVKGREEAVSILDKLKAHNEKENAKLIATSPIGSVANDLKDNNNTSAINTVLDKTGYTVENVAIIEEVSNNRNMGFNVLDKDGNIVEGYGGVDADSVTKFVEGLDAQSMGQVRQNGLEAVAYTIENKERLLKEEQVVIKNDPKVELGYYQNNFQSNLTNQIRSNFKGTDAEWKALGYEEELEKAFANVNDRNRPTVQQANSMTGQPYSSSRKSPRDKINNYTKGDIFAGVSEGLKTEISNVLDFKNNEGNVTSEFINKGLLANRENELLSRESNIVDKYIATLPENQQQVIEFGQKLASQDVNTFKKNITEKVKISKEVYTNVGGLLTDKVKTTLRDLGIKDVKFDVEQLPGGMVFSLNVDRELTPEEDKRFKIAQVELLKAQKSFSNLRSDYEGTMGNISKSVTEFQTNNKYDKELLKSSVKEYDILDLVAKDINDSVYGVVLALPTLVNADWAVREQRKLNKKNEFYETMGSYDDGNFWKYAARTASQQTGNILLAAATGGMGNSLKLSGAVVEKAIGGAVGISSGTQSYRDLKSTQQIAGTADKQAILAKEAYKTGKIDLYEYTSMMKDINTARAMLEISDEQVMGAAMATGIIEGTFTWGMSSAGNTMKLLKDFKNPTNVVSIARNAGKSDFAKFTNLIGKPLVTRTGGEVVEELSILAATNLVSEHAILGREFELDAWDDTALSTIITVGATQSTGITYSGIMTYGATKDFEKVVNKLRINNDELSVLLQQDNLDDRAIALLTFDMTENLKEMGIEVDRLSVDLLSKGSVDIKRLISSELARNQVLSEAGIKPGDSETRKAELIDIHKEKIGKEGAELFDSSLNVLDKQINKIKDTPPDYAKAEKSLGGIWTNTDADLSNEVKYGKGGKDGYKNKTKQDKLVAVINETRQNVINENVEAARSIDGIEEKLDRDYSKSEKGRKRTKKEVDAELERFGKIIALKKSKAFSTSLNVNRKAADIFGDVKNINIVEYDSTNEKSIIALLVDAGLDIKSQDFADAKAKLLDNKVYGLVVNNTLVTQNKEQAEKDLLKGDVRAGTVVLHEFNHILDDSRMKTPESRKKYADNLFEAASTSKNQALHQAHVDVVDMLNEVFGSTNETFENSEKYRDEYTKYLQENLYAYEDEIQIEKDDSFVTRIFNNTDAGNLNTPDKALSYLAANNSLFRKGKISKKSKKAIKNFKGTDTKASSKTPKTTVNELAIKYQDGTIADNDLVPFIDQYQNLVLSAMGYNIGKGDIPADNAIGFANGEFGSIMKNYKPIDKAGKKQAFTTYVNGVMRLGRGNKFYKQELEPAQKQVRIGEGMDFAGGTSAESNLSMEERQAKEDKEVVIKIDPRKFRVAEPKIKAIEAAVDITVENDIAPFKADFKTLSAKYGTKVASIMYDITEGKLNKNANLTYAKKISDKGIPEDSEAGRIQNDFDTKNDQEVKRFLKLLPPENVSGKDVQVGPQGEEVKVSKDVQGRSLGLSKRVLDFFYDEKTDARSSGLSSQPFIRKLKAKYGVNAKITPETIKELQDAMGITPAKQLNKYDRNIGTFLAGVAKLKGAIVTNTVAVEKVKDMDTSKSSKPKKQILADISAGRSSIQFSEKVKTIFSKALFEQKTKGVDNLLKSYGLDGTFKFKTRADVDAYVLEVKKNLLPLMPKSFWFGKPNKKGNYGTVFTPSSKVLGTTAAGKALYKDYYASEMKKLAKDEKQKYGAPVYSKEKDADGKFIEYDFSISSYDTLFKTVDVIKAKTKSGDITKFNDKVGAIHQAMWYRFKKAIKENKNSANVIGSYLKITGSDTSHWHKLGAQFVGYSSKITGSRFEYEHAMPATSAYLYLLDVALSNDNSFERAYDFVIDNYKLISLDKAMDEKLIAVGLRSRMPIGWNLLDNKWYDRYFSPLVATQDGGINPAGLIGIDGKSFQETYRINANGSPYLKGTFKPNASTEVIKNNTADKAMANARSPKYSEKIKKARVFDFDDTLAQTKSNVLYTMPDGTTGAINPATFAKEAGNMEAEGAVWDFSEFSKVMEGKKGPLFDVAKKIQDVRGSEDIFVLTARPQDAAGPIKEFLASLGLNIPLKNITGLANGAPQAKADWMVGKFAEGYNDFYFTDDHMGNVKAVKDVLSVLDVKSKVQQARLKFSEKLSENFNLMIERNKGVNANAVFSEQNARRKGVNQKRFSFWIPPSADDFRGLTMYTFAGTGKKGEADQEFFDKALIKPYTRGVNEIERAKQKIKNDYTALIKNYPKVRKKLRKKIGDTKYTNDEAIRIYLWSKAGMDIPGLSRTDQKKIVKLVAADAELVDFSAGVKLITRLDEYVAPNEFWDASTILGDLNRVGRDINRKEYLREFIENVDIIFSKENLNKVQAIYGFRVRESIEQSIDRMKSGSNASPGSGRIVQKWNEWVNNSVGAIMFFNRRSALLQMLSAGNFINWNDNNPAKAALAFANQPQYWKDWIRLFNSDKLKQRRSGLEGDIQEAEIAQASKKGGMTGVISYILKLGFTPTQIADSIAIASGGSTFYRNRINTYKKQGLDTAEAEAKAFEDFSEISDETQQSADPMLISSQQASILGRLVLAFQNTTMQYARLTKKAAQDLINGRGSKKENISKILYYSFIQNMIFNGLQNALFALVPGFGDEEEDWETDKEKARYDDKKQRAEENKTARIIHGMVDSVVKGTGLAGAVGVSIKNTIREYIEYHDKPVFAREKGDIMLAALQISPPIGSKVSKINSFLQTEYYERDVIAERGFDVVIDGKFQLSPSYKMIGSLTAATLNLPLDRAVDEINSITEAFDTRNTQWQRLALGLGWRSWDAGVKIEEHDLIKTAAKAKRKIEGKEKGKETRRINKEKKWEYLDYRDGILNRLPDSIRINVVNKQERDFPGKDIPAYKLQQLEEKYLDLK